MRYVIKRIYEPVGEADGARVLVDRIWPRGIAKANARVDLWLKEVAPTTELRKWFGHDPALFAEFKSRYVAELGENPAVQELRDFAADHDLVTLLYGAHDEEHNQAVVLADFLKG